MSNLKEARAPEEMTAEYRKDCLTVHGHWARGWWSDSRAQAQMFGTFEAVPGKIRLMRRYVTEAEEIE